MPDSPSFESVSEKMVKVFLNVPSFSVEKSLNDSWLASESRWDPGLTQVFLGQTLCLITLKCAHRFWRYPALAVVVHFLATRGQKNSKTRFVGKHLSILTSGRHRAKFIWAWVFIPHYNSIQCSLFLSLVLVSTSPIYNLSIPYVTPRLGNNPLSNGLHLQRHFLISQMSTVCPE